MESLPDRVYFKDIEGRFLAVSQAHAASFNLTNPDDVIGKTDFDFFEESQARQKFADEREIIRTGVGFIGKEERASAAGESERWVISSKLPLLGDDGKIIGTFGISRDITEMKIAREVLEAHHRLLETLIDILPCRIFVKDTEGRLRLTNEAYRQAVGAKSATEVEGRRIDELVSDMRSSNTLSDDRAVLSGRSILNREEYDTSPLGRKRWMLLSKVPLLDNENRVRGIVGMSADITEPKEAEARAIRAQRELEVQNRQIEAELAVARDLQTELMSSGLQSIRDELDPTAPFTPKIASHYEPCEYLAGDFFHLIPISNRSFGLLLCDVMGHGVKAALVTTLIRGLLADARAKGEKPGQVLEQLNERLCVLLDRPPLPRFVTALYATFDLNLGHLNLASAGHTWPLVQPFRQPARPITETECGPALGLIRGTSYPSVEIDLKQSDRFLLFTDGWVEEPNQTGEEFGIKRLLSAFDRCASAPPSGALMSMASEVGSFSSKSVRSDDLCAVLVAL